MNIQVNNTSQEVLVKVIDCVGDLINQTDISDFLGVDCGTIVMLIRIDELLGVLQDQNVVLGEEELNALNQHLVNLEKAKYRSEETELYEFEVIVGNLLDYLRRILALKIVRGPDIYVPLQ